MTSRGVPPVVFARRHLDMAHILSRARGHNPVKPGQDPALYHRADYFNKTILRVRVTSPVWKR